MDWIWRLANRALDAVSRNHVVLVAAVGIGLARIFHGWQLGAGQRMLTAYDPHLMTDAGEIAVFVFLAAWAVRRGPLCRRGWPLVLALGGLGFAMAAAKLSEAGIFSVALGAAGYISAGATYALLLLIWLELCGCLAPLQATLAFASSYAVGLVGWILLRPVSGTVGYGGATMLCLACAVLLVWGYRFVPEAALPRFAKEASGRRRRGLSVPMLLWIASLSFVYGFGDCFTRMGFSTLASKLGMVVPVVVLLIGLKTLHDGVDIRTIYRMSLVLMAVGVVPTVLFDVLPAVSQVLMSAAQAGNVIVACTVACTSAHRRHESALFASGVLLAVDLVAILLGNLFGMVFIGGCFPLSEPLARVVGTALVMVAVLLSAYLMHDEDLSSFVTDAPSKPLAVPCKTESPSSGKPAESTRVFEGLRLAVEGKDPALVASACSEVAECTGLSKREATVFRLMVDGKNIAAIGEELFIAPGTVRAHMSRIYEKLGVHSREEFGRLLGL